MVGPSEFLVLNKGKYGHRQIVSSELITECFRGKREPNPMFGMGFWLKPNR